MTKDRNVLRAVAEAVERYGLREPSTRLLRKAIAARGFEVRRFGGEDDTQTDAALSKAFPGANKKDAFSAAFSEDRAVYLRVGLSDEDSLRLMAREFGALVLFGDPNGVMILDGDQSRMADDFADELLSAMNRGTLGNLAAFHPKKLALGVVGILAASMFFIIFAFPSAKPTLPSSLSVSKEAVQTSETLPTEPVSADGVSDPFAPIADPSALPGFDPTLVTPTASAAVTTNTLPDRSVPSDTPVSVTPSGYYATSSGSKYHAEGCSYIKGKANLRSVSAEDIAAGKFTPCSRCIK